MKQAFANEPGLRNAAEGDGFDREMWPGQVMQHRTKWDAVVSARRGRGAGGSVP